MTELRTQTVHVLLNVFWQSLLGEVRSLLCVQCSAGIHIKKIYTAHVFRSCPATGLKLHLLLNTPHSPLIFAFSNMGVFDA